MYWINEIFYSIQGEGANVGMPAIFIRFSGCNLDCTFCDTDHKHSQQLTLEEVIRGVEGFGCQTVILTGGEPTLQVDAELIQELKGRGYYICIETNGTREILPGIDWVTVSPKEHWKVKQGDELKVVYTGQEIEDYQGDFKFFFLQPCSKGNVAETIEKVKENPKWRLSIQLQKVLKIS